MSTMTVTSGLPRLIPPGSPLSLAAHIDRYGPVPLQEARDRSGLRAVDLIAEVERAGLTGRGGAGFPTGRKLRAVAQAGRGGSGSSSPFRRTCSGVMPRSTSAISTSSFSIRR